MAESTGWDAVLPEPLLHDVVDALVRLIEATGALIVVVGAGWAFAQCVTAALLRRRSAHRSFVAIRLGLGRFLALGLEFQLAADILLTAVAPSFAQIGQLAAVAAIRTALNFFLTREIDRERREVERGSARAPGDGPGGAPERAR